MTMFDYDIKPETRVKVTITGTVKGKLDGAHSYTQKVVDDNGSVHHVFFGTSGAGLKFEELESFVTGKAYQDGDEEVFIRAATGWIDSDGQKRLNTYPTRPLRLLKVPA